MESMQRQPLSPCVTVQVHQHFLFQFIFSVIDVHGIVRAVQSMDQRLQSEERWKEGAHAE